MGVGSSKDTKYVAGPKTTLEMPTCVHVVCVILSPSSVGGIDQ